MEVSQKIRTLFLTGALGTGKTTGGIRIVAQAISRGMRAAYIVNDIGKENIDFARVQEAFPDLPAVDLSSACIGCNAAEDFYEAIEEMRKQEIDFLAIEPTGILLGREVEQIMSDLQSKCDFTVATMLGVAQLLDNPTIQASEDSTASQIKLASVIGLTWCNQLEKFAGVADPRLDPVHEFIGAHASNTPVFVLSDGTGPLDESFIDAIFSAESRTIETPASAGDHHHHHGDHSSHGHATTGTHTRSFILRGGLRWVDLTARLGEFMGKIKRAKGDDGYEVIDWVSGRLNTRPLVGDPTHKIVLISDEPIPDDIIQQVTDGSPVEYNPENCDLDGAVKELLRSTSPLQPTPDSVLPIDPQAYLAYTIAVRPGCSQELRERVINLVIERLISAAEVLPEIPDPQLSIPRTIGASLGFFTWEHRSEISDDLLARVVAVKPSQLLHEGLVGLEEIGDGTGITGAGTRPSFLRNALDLTIAYQAEGVAPLREAFAHCAKIAPTDAKSDWEALAS